MKDKKTEEQVKLLNARINCVIDLLHLNGELVKCALASLGKKDQYEKVTKIYDKHWLSIINDCANEIEKIKLDTMKPDFENLTVDEARALNESARRTCEMDG